MITLDGKPLSDFGMYVQSGYEYPGTPSISSKTLAIPGKTGLYMFGAELNERVMVLPIIFIKQDATDKQHNIRKFITYLHDEYGNPKDLQLVFSYEPDKYYTVRLNEQIVPERLYTTASFEVAFIASNPYAYSKVLADEVTWGSEIITFQSSYLLGRGRSDGLTTVTGNTTLNILVDGIAIKPIIEIVGSATSLVISANGYNITLPSFSSSTWQIDCEKYTVTKNGTSTFGEVSLRDFILLPGNNQVSVTGTGINITLHIKARDKFI